MGRATDRKNASLQPPCSATIVVMDGDVGFVTAADGVRLRYVEIGTASDVAIAPGVGNEADFAPVARRRTVVFFDVRNRGRSDPVPDDGEVGFPVEVDDIEAVRDHFGVDEVDVVGWSYVGLVAALYAARYPQRVRRLVLVCPAPLRHQAPPPPTDAGRRAMEAIAGLREGGLDRTDPVAFARAWRRITSPTRMGDPAAFDELRSDPAEWPNEWPDHMMAAMARVMDSHPPGFDYTDEVRKIAAPTLIVAGEADRFPSPEAIGDWASAVPGARLVVLPQVGHYPQAEAPDAFFDAVDAFLASS